MKTKMKSAFAFIAVALMIMVAVVPMVGVFTEDSSAATTIVPADGTKNITVEGTVYDSETQKIKDVLVKVSYGTYAEYGLTGNDGKYKIPVNFKGESVDLTVDIVTDSANYKKYSGLSTTNPVDGKFTGTTTQEIKGVTGNVTGIDFMSGMISISGKLTYANTTVAYDKEVIISVKTVVAEGEIPGVVASSTSKTDGTYSVLVPINSGKVKVSAEGFKETGELTVAKANITTGTNLVNENTYKISVTYGNVFGDNALSATSTADSKVTVVTFTKVDEKNEYTLIYKVVTGDGKTTTDVTFSDEKGYMWDVKKSLDGSAISLKEDAYVTGAVKMGTLAILGTDAVTVESVKFFKGETDTEKTGEFKLTGDGKYVIALGKIGGLKESEANKVKFTAAVNTEVKRAMDVAISLTSASTGKDIAMPADGYYLISGVVKNGTANVNGLEITVTSNNAIGLVDSKVTTGTDGKYAFYAKSGEEVTITPSVENDAAFSPSSYKFNAIANKTVNFEMDSKPLVSAAVTDAAGVALKDVEVFYKIGVSGTYNTTAIKTDKDGKFKITVNSNVSADNVLVYFKDAKYTFNSNKDEPFALSSTDDKYWKANEQTLTFEVKDAAGKDIANISGLALQFAKYKIHAVGAGVNAFDMIGTASDVTYDATTKEFSFVAKSISETGDYRLAYGISVKSNTTDYTFATITEYAENLVIEANEQTFTGKVTDAATSDAKELKGMTVAVYGTDGKTKLSKDVTTLNDGSFSVISKSGTLKAVDPNGVYTFNDGTADSSTGVYTIKANEQTYSGEVKDADNKLVKNAKITVKVVDADGKTIGSVATVGKDGKYSIITKLTAGNKVVATDADAKRTFKDVVIGTSAMVIPDVVSGQYTLSGTVKEMTSDKAIKDITVTLSTYSATVDPVLVSTAVTNEKGEYSFFVNEKAGYGVVATSSGNYIFSEGKMSFTDHVANIVTKYAISEGTVEEVTGGKVLSGIKVTAYGIDDVVVGEYVTDKVGKFKYPAIVNESGLSLIKFKAVDPNGAYTFADGLTSGNIKAKEKTVTVTIMAHDSGDGLSLAGVTVNFLKDEKVVKTATTDAKGKASVIIAAVDEIKAVDGNTAYGAMTFDSVLQITTIMTGGTIYADQTVYSGFYANGDVVSGVEVTYEMSKVDAYVEKGKAVVIDNKYYIASAATAVDKIVITANAQGFYAVNTFNSLTSIGTSDLKIKEKPGIVKVDEDDVLFGEFYTVYNATNAQVGDKIILRASEVAYKPLEDGNETTVVKYKFDGWYVNGVKVSDDLEYVYTVTEDCLVYADYKASTYEAASDDNGISPSVLVIGIAAVIVALIAVVYTVIQKKE